MLGVGGGGGGAVGLSAIARLRAYRWSGVTGRSLPREREGRGAKRATDWGEQLVVCLPEPLQVVREPAMDLREVGAERVQLLVDLRPVQGEDEPVAREQDEQARRKGRNECHQSDDDEPGRIRLCQGTRAE